MSEIVPGLFIGNSASSYSTASLHENNIKSILTVNESDRRQQRRSDSLDRIVPKGRHLTIPTEDYPTQDLLVHMRSACGFIETSIALGGVLVHCWHGVSRSATFVIAYLMRRDRRSLEDVLIDVKLKRNVRPNASFLDQLKVWEEVEYNVWRDEERRVPKKQYAKILKERNLRILAVRDSEWRQSRR